MNILKTTTIITMKNLLSFGLALLLGVSLNAQSYCLQLTPVSNDGENLILKISMQGDIPFNLGTSNLQFGFSDEALGTPVLHQSEMAPPVYFNPTVTMPLDAQCSFNIELAFPDTGIEIAGYPGWTELGLVKFSILNSAVDYDLSWTYNGGTTETVAFLDDETTMFFAAADDCLSVDGVTAIEELDFFQDLSLYPNPTIDQVNLSYFLNEPADVAYTMYDALSRVLLEGNVDQKSGEQKLTFDVKEFTAGQYMITLVVDDVLRTERFEIVR